MSMDFDVLFDTNEDSIDMKAGLDTLQGVSDATRHIAEAILTKKVHKRLSHKGKVRTKLKRRFKGSYGQVFGLEIYDAKLGSRFREIGGPVFSELIAYFIAESIYKESNPLSESAQEVLYELGKSSEALVNQLRLSALENIHEVSSKFDQEVKFRYRKNRSEITEIGRFNRSTALALKPVESIERIDITACITRLNIYTGNGRLLLEGEDETIAFGFENDYKLVAIKAKKLFSENLNHNNGIERDEWQYLKLSVSPIKLRSGQTIKYLVKGIHNEK